MSLRLVKRTTTNTTRFENKREREEAPRKDNNNNNNNNNNKNAELSMFSTTAAKNKAKGDEEANAVAQASAQLAAMQQRKDNQYNAQMAIYDWLDRLVMDKKRFVTTFLAYTFCVIVMGVYIGDWNSATMPGREQGQWCAMQAKECKRQADVCLVSGGITSWKRRSRWLAWIRKKHSWKAEILVGQILLGEKCRSIFSKCTRNGRNREIIERRRYARLKDATGEFVVSRT